ncbi:TonB-dependent receptor [Fulvivirga sp. M361]|uniref:TonB-dependent receptor n=1 Tax=Fulvivirga sp. M361 TaxID=2594266 RepID=UPI00117B9C66|nr:carboxypeptidase-like regulatory domain-containing protein [Fulvivirga sp. M361]TRX51389.1 TonB-dependent receptor [Fulvivirga sp. M361]
MRNFPYLFFLLFLTPIINAWSQDQITISGAVTNEKSEPLQGASVAIKGTNTGVITNDFGEFTLSVVTATSISLLVSFVGYETKEVSIDNQTKINIVLKEATEVLNTIEIEGQKESRSEVSLTTIAPKTIKALPSAFGDFTKILATLSGVVSNNELSSTYSVRGGSFDENLVYVNNIPVYRPFLVTNGQQEGLSFINPDLVNSVEFSAGGWQSNYGDKLSSVLNVKYKEPTKLKASATLGLLGGSANLEGSGKRISAILGVRHKSAQYLLNTLETEGQYLPRFTDIQSYINIDLGSKPNRTKLGILSSYARNRYLVEPESRETDFGTFNQSLRLFVAFEGQEILEYDTYQSGLNLTHHVNDRLTTQFIASVVRASEREFTDVEGGYRLCDVDRNVGSSTFNDCVFTRGIGTNANFGRNTLDATIYDMESRNILTVDSKTVMEFGLGFNRQIIDDVLSENDFIDSSDFVIERNFLEAENKIEASRLHAYGQVSRDLSARMTSTLGVRLNYWSFNEELIISPRWQISYRTNWVRDIVFKGAIGFYAQPPFYRELRDFEGNLNQQLKAQQSVHFIAGLDYNFRWWGRGFKFYSEIYYKELWNVIPYEVDNVRVRYYANNDAKAFATGLDLRLSGEFIEGTQSWFSLGILNTREDVENDGNGYIRRPSDQRLTLGIFFQDHLPNDPTIRVNLGIQYGSGLPFGPPNNFENRNRFNGDTYRRVDIGFAKLFYLSKPSGNYDKQLLLSAEILNLLGAPNAISYLWVSDVNNQQFAVPNSLSARFLNVKLTLNI